MEMRVVEPWSIEDSAALYNVDGWGAGYFSINEKGHVQVAPRANGATIDLCELVSEIQERGLELPQLIRFPDIIDTQIIRLNQAFAEAIAEYGYGSEYRGVFPIKVNQQRQIIEEVATFGKRYRMGLEIGSKPELLIALSMLDPEDGFIICNGYKDRAFIEMALLAKQLGFTCVIVIERLAELPSILHISKEMGIAPQLGVRAKLATRGEGRWGDSSGDRAKFGVRADELMQILRLLREADALSSLTLLHFHIGSQIPTVRTVAAALNEAGRLYVELCRAGAPLSYLDVGGGLAVDYDGYKSGIASSSTNYDMNEYARCVIQTLAEVCNEAGVEHPTLVSESGRSLVSHHSVMVMEVLDTDARHPGVPERTANLEKEPRVIANLYETVERIDSESYQEAYHDAVRFRDEAVALFNHGILGLEDRARAEQLFICCCLRIRRAMSSESRIPEEMTALEERMADTYYCNLSFFQSLPDSWAIKQIFPILPL
ncbi:MAG: biosynthetic arginine decarboxylase, partial [Planctomycetota bacterium]